MRREEEEKEIFLWQKDDRLLIRGFVFTIKHFNQWVPTGSVCHLFVFFTSGDMLFRFVGIFRCPNLVNFSEIYEQI